MRCPAKNGNLICVRDQGHGAQFFPPEGHNWQPAIEAVSVADSMKCYPEYVSFQDMAREIDQFIDKTTADGRPTVDRIVTIISSRFKPR